MAILNGFLDNFTQGATNPKGNLGDFKHAARLYADDTFRLAPKTKFLFFVVFSVSPEAQKVLPGYNLIKQEVGLLAKTIDLPQYSANVEIKNQYNRKKLVQTGIEYTPVTISMHDDNFGLTTLLLEAYYRYYFRDSDTSIRQDGYKPRDAYSEARDYRYGLDNGRTTPFFDSIKLYQFSRKEFTEFKLVNPLIEKWGHDTMDQSDGTGLAENTMVLNYEAVTYNRGRVEEDNPDYFGTSHYDNVPSPLTLEGGGVANLLGEGGVGQGGLSVLGDIASGQVNGATLLRGINTARNAGDLSRGSLIQEGIGVATSAISAVGQNNPGGLAGTFFGGLNNAEGSGVEAGQASEATSPGPGSNEVPRAQKVASARGLNTP